MDDKSQNIASLLSRMNISNLEEILLFPKYFMIEPIDCCNARCKMCKVGQNYEKATNTRMAEELFSKIIEEMIPFAEWIEMVSVYGRGEPLIDGGLEYKIEKLTEIGIKRIQVSTNAALLDSKRSERLLSCGLNDLRISIDSIHKDVYESIRPGLNFERVIKNTLECIRIRDEKHSDIPIRIRGVELPENKDERDDWLDYWGSKLRDIDNAEFIPYSSNQAGEYVENGITIPCTSVFSTMIIRSNGDVVICCADLLDEYVVGNVYKNSIKEIWAGENMQRIRDIHLNGKRNSIKLCRGCTLWTK